MRRLRLLLLIIITALLVSTAGRVASQDERVPLTTASGLTFSVAQDWFVMGLEGSDSFSVVDPEGIVTMSVTFPADLDTNWGITPVTLDELMAHLLEDATLEGVTLGEFDMQKRETGIVLIQPYDSAYYAGAQLATQFYNGDYAVITVLIVDFDFERLPAMIDEALNVLDSVAFPVPAILYQTPRLPADMPPGQIVFVSGARITIPDGWTVADASLPVEFRVELLSPDGQASITVEEPDDPARTLADYQRTVAPELALAAGDDDFDPASHFSVLSLANNRQLLTYDAMWHRPEGSTAPPVWYQLIATHFGVLQVTTRAPDSAGLDAAFDAALYVAETYDVSGILIDGGDCSTCGLPPA